MKGDVIPELLAPAGNLSCAVTALDSGADAVYAGMGRFNAREGADNFSLEDLSRLAAYAKERNRRYYITLNTLLKENEIEEAAAAVGLIEDLQPDALIVQDLGLVRVLRELYPAIPVHASTQMGIHNLAGVRAAADLGMSRVILERQIDLTELEAIAADSPVELEVFIHGALCCSLSGMCLFSSWMGGWSGNRGRCKQPCRRRYHQIKGREKESGFFFSTRDLYSLDLISRYRKMGIASLKIEGRLKKEEYVEQVVRAYRLMLDAPEGEEERSLGEARLILSRSFGRHWSHGFATEEDRRELIQPSSPGVSGLLVGEVLSVRGTSFTAKISRRIHRGDRLRLQDASGGEASAFLLMEMRKQSKSVTRAEEGDVVSIFAPFEAEAGARLYKVGESRKKTGRDPATLPLLRSSTAVDISVKLNRDGLTVAAAGKSTHFDIEPEEAKNRAINREMLQDLFKASRSDDYRLGSFSAEIEGEWFIPPGNLKRIRRTFWESLIEELDDAGTGREDSESLFRKRFAELRSRLRTREAASGALAGKGVRTVYIDQAAPGEEALLPIYVPETAMDGFTRSLANALERGVRRFRISSLFQFAPLLEEVRKRGVERKELFLTASWPLPAANSLAADLLASLGADRVQAWIELDREGERLLIDSAGVAVEQFVSGRIPLLVTRAEVAVDGTIVDSRGRSFHTAPPGPYGLTVLWSGEGYEAEAVPGAAARFSGDLLPGYGNPGPGRGEPSLFNRDREWK